MTDEEGCLECPICSNMHLQLVLSKYQVINHKPWLDNHGEIVLSSHHPQKGRKTDFYICQYCYEFEQENLDGFGDNPVYQSNVAGEFIHEVNE